MRAITTTLFIALMPCVFAQEPAEDLLPDLIVDEAYLHDYRVVDDVAPGRIHLRLSNATPNVGLGPLYVYGVLPVNPDGSQDVNQRIFRSDGTYEDRAASRFVYHPEHEHIHLEDWALYRLREVLPDGGVGPIVAEGGKTSFCLRDSRAYDASLPNAPPLPEFTECAGAVQGISVGYEDVYTKDLPDQWIDITGLPWGSYWLESVVDPEDRILESDENNNVERIRVQVRPPNRPLLNLPSVILFFLIQLINAIRGLLGLPPFDTPEGGFPL